MGVVSGIGVMGGIGVVSEIGVMGEIDGVLTTSLTSLTSLTTPTPPLHPLSLYPFQTTLLRTGYSVKKHLTPWQRHHHSTRIN
ncbi:hypothetical protein CWM47_28700 [Spirosoma pollinicola]|uniref:Uncharacterized protein n=1 Tax=Spirosoma pollinicola TaxID=2057025 RepID=A0A2K8Z6L2_9BACT|nr:hypothetical protein CWM47_28700 [Spirosoma pollinicola]